MKRCFDKAIQSKASNWSQQGFGSTCVLVSLISAQFTILLPTWLLRVICLMKKSKRTKGWLSKFAHEKYTENIRSRLLSFANVSFRLIEISRAYCIILSNTFHEILLYTKQLFFIYLLWTSRSFQMFLFSNWFLWCSSFYFEQYFFRRLVISWCTFDEN